MSKTLQKIQEQLKAPKGQTNKFGGYKYRSCEDIMEAVKPILAQHGCALTVSDEIIAVGERVYVKATATLLGAGDDPVVVSASAREPETKKGMDEAQITGATSSYARKYALNGLFAIDDTKDADATNDHGSMKPADAIEQLQKAQTIDDLQAAWKALTTELKAREDVSTVKDAKKEELTQTK
ncbi:MAG: ERF family protein [Phaeodactylibacter sp.]|nr:ERF family protein [Phaeodactylibacter sp.]